MIPPTPVTRQRVHSDIVYHTIMNLCKSKVRTPTPWHSSSITEEIESFHFCFILHCWTRFKALYRLGLGYIKDCLIPYIPAWSLRFSGESPLAAPRGLDGQLIFSIVSPNLLSSLPVEVKRGPLLPELTAATEDFFIPASHFNWSLIL